MKSIRQPTFDYIILFFITLLFISNVTSWNYKIKLVKDIIETEKFGVHVARLVVTRAYSSIDTNKLGEEARLQMCKDASKIDDLKNRRIKFPTNQSKSTGRKTVYTIQSEEYPDEQELGEAFTCPTKPLIYLQLHYVDELVWVIVKTNELPDVCDIPNDYELKIVEDITDIDSLQTLSFAEVAAPPLDLNECSENLQLGMCRKASTVDYLRGREIKIRDDDTPQPAIFYRLNSTRYNELVLAFKCPTEPAIYLQVHKNNDGTQTVLAIVERSDLFF